MEVMAKGPNFVYGKEYIIQKYGTTVWDAVINQLDGDAAAVWKSMLVPVGEYPFTAFKSMTVNLSRHMGAPSVKEVSDMYEFIAERSLNKLYKIMFKATTPAFVISYYPKLWDRFFCSGEVTVPVAGKGRAEVNFVLPTIFSDWLDPACLGYSRKAIEIAGGRNVAINTLYKKSLQTGEFQARYELTWDE